MKNKELKKEVEQKIKKAKAVGYNGYCVSFKGVESYVKKVAKLGFKVEKNFDGNYTIRD
jgi:hypothetical protein